MYEELIASLRERAETRYDGKTGNEARVYKTILSQAADAIEELQGRAKVLEKLADHWCEAAPKWIPVTERLPEKHEWVLVKSKFVKMKTDFISNDGHWYTTPAVTHWMPLPEPPKEESNGV